jgi:hypothetical protein
MSATSSTGQSVDLIYLGEASTPKGWYVSHWNAGQSRILKWSTAIRPRWRLPLFGPHYDKVQPIWSSTVAEEVKQISPAQA